MPVDTDDSYPVIAGLAVGIVFIAIFALFVTAPATRLSPEPNVSIVRILSGVGMPSQPQRFEPRTINVTVGLNNTVQWISQDGVPDSVVSDSNYIDPVGGNFSTFAHLPDGYILPGQTFNFTFSQPGTYGYHSVPHPFMQGKVVVSMP